MALQQAAGDPQDVVVVLADQPRVDLVAGELVQRALVGRVQPPEGGRAGVREPWGVQVAEQPVEREHDVGVTGCVGHDLPRPHAGLRVKQRVEDVRGVWLGAGDLDRPQAGVVVGGRAERGDAAATVEVAAVVAGVNRAPGDDEAQPVDGSDLAAAPALGERQFGVVVDDAGVRGGDRVGAQVALRDVAQA